jgi:hypothetical protein
MDRIMFWLHAFTIGYHSFRGSGIGRWKSITLSYAIARPSDHRSIGRFQKNTWKIMKEISSEDNMRHEDKPHANV